MDKSILTEEEASTPVTFGDLQVALESISKMICEAQIAQDEISFNSLKETIGIVADQINSLKYNQIRDMRFCLAFLSQISHISENVVNKAYDNWCIDWDRLNKEKL